MPLGGAGLAGINHANKKPTKKCERCGLRYPEEDEVCIHCGKLDDSELLQLKESIEEEHKAHFYLGRKFYAVALMVFVMLLLSYFSQ